MAVSTITGGAGFVSEQLRVQLAKRNAEQAEVTARSLSRQAAVAQQAADVAQEGARVLQVRSDQAQSNAGQARQQVTTLQSVQTLKQELSTTYSQIAAGLAVLDAPPAPSPSVNAEGQTTGTVVNVTA